MSPQEFEQTIAKAIEKILGGDVEVRVVTDTGGEPCEVCGEVHGAERHESLDKQRLEAIVVLDKRIAALKRIVHLYEKLQRSISVPLDDRKGSQLIQEILLTKEIDSLMEQL